MEAPIPQLPGETGYGLRWTASIRILLRFASRPGGYTQIIRLATRRVGDNAEICVMRYIPVKEEKKAKGKKAPQKPTKKKAAPKQEAASKKTKAAKKPADKPAKAKKPAKKASKDKG